ncbi:protein shisa-like-2B [Pollicipes pollicipes]|uniref:protein shisa-like-2B n=1 Tax=Pollicipes pollicipes TaxID=41117 RepID=UPI0018851881|nr:protein shisa-like-2B [Pollicipes pollicipes]
MSIQMQLGQDHEVLSQDPFCSGYVDSFGKWNNGFACPKLEEEPVFCCGTSTYRYCCTARDETDPDVFSQSMPLVMGVVFGTLITVVLVITAICVFWKSCRTYKKRRSGGGPMYRMQSSSTTSGVANMYSCSSGSLSHHDGRGGPHDLEDVLQDVDEVAVTRPCRLSTINTIPRTFTSDRCNRVSFADSVGNSSASTTTDNERQLFIEQSGGLPPPYKQDADLPPAAEARLLPFPRSFCVPAEPHELDVGHYQVPRPPGDDVLYRSTKF